MKDRQLSSEPDEFHLKQYYPNPFNPETVIEYGVSEGELVVVRVYNVCGELICELSRGHRKAGRYRVIWDGRDDAGSVVSSGVYLIEVTAGVEREVIKAMFLK
ncbi:T9SS type A sorting domain-containing protein [candidate division KSB1 bacterium]|nr:T9SS type A sorting domain-containing protein [candidate division KSB1 bacterium]